MLYILLLLAEISLFIFVEVALLSCCAEFVTVTFLEVFLEKYLINDLLLFNVFCGVEAVIVYILAVFIFDTAVVL